MSQTLPEAIKQIVASADPNIRVHITNWLGQDQKQIEIHYGFISENGMSNCYIYPFCYVGTEEVYIDLPHNNREATTLLYSDPQFSDKLKQYVKEFIKHHCVA